MALNNLPGFVISTVDGGLTIRRQPTADSILIIATAGKGVINQPYPVTDRSVAAQEFGTDGNLIRTMEEAALNSDNITLFRMGAKQATLAGIGVDTSGSPTAGFGLSFGQATSKTSTDYTIWYKNGVVAVYYQGSLVFSNDPAQTIDAGDVVVTGTISGNAGIQLGTGASASAANAITLQAAAALVGTETTPIPVLTGAVTGVGLNGRQSFVAFLQALSLLEGYQIDQVVVPAAQLDAPNVAFHVASDATTAQHNPSANANALDWLKTTYDAYGTPTFQWASETIDSNGGTVTAMGVVANAADRQAAGFFEVSWGYSLANFCASVSTLNRTCLAVLGTSASASYKLADVRKWVGYLPKYDANGNVTTPGAGLCGIPYTVGTNASKLNPLAADFGTGYRQPGFFQTVDGTYEGAQDQDKNGNPVDIGAYLHVVADQAILSNGFASNYVANVAAFAAGQISALDEKVALTNQPVNAKQLPGLVYTPGQLDSLTQAKINVLRYKGSNKRAAFLHDLTLATSASDYTQVLRMRIKGLVVFTMLQIGDPFLGASSLDGLQLNSLKTALDNGLVELQKRGYVSNPQVVITTTPAESKIGHANLDLTFHAADQLVRLNASVGLSA